MEFGNKFLYSVAEQLGVQEIVVPDTLGDANDTIAKGLAFTRYTRTGYRYMMVAQGSNITEVMQTIDMIATDQKFMYVTTVGIPRLVNKGNPEARHKISQLIDARGYNRVLEFHYLGASSPLSEVKQLVETGVGRGIDTSSPIYMGYWNFSLKRYDPYMKRPEHYFRFSEDAPLIKENVETYLEWAQYDRDAELPERSEHNPQASTS